MTKNIKYVSYYYSVLINLLKGKGKRDLEERSSLLFTILAMLSSIPAQSTASNLHP